MKDEKRVSKKIPKSELCPHDHTFLYGNIYNALVDMEPYFLGGRWWRKLINKPARQFRTAMFLAKRLHANRFVSCNNNDFCITDRDLFKKRQEIQHLHLELLMKILAKKSQDWWGD
jgi:hypothetical protein